MCKSKSDGKGELTLNTKYILRGQWVREWQLWCLSRDHLENCTDIIWWHQTLVKSTSAWIGAMEDDNIYMNAWWNETFRAVLKKTGERMKKPFGWKEDSKQKLVEYNGGGALWSQIKKYIIAHIFEYNWRVLSSHSPSKTAAAAHWTRLPQNAHRHCSNVWFCWSQYGGQG